MYNIKDLATLGVLSHSETKQKLAHRIAGYEVRAEAVAGAAAAAGIALLQLYICARGIKSYRWKGA